MFAIFADKENFWKLKASKFFNFSNAREENCHWIVKIKSLKSFGWANQVKIYSAKFSCFTVYIKHESFTILYIYMYTFFNIKKCSAFFKKQIIPIFQWSDSFKKHPHKSCEHWSWWFSPISHVAYCTMLKNGYTGSSL